MTVRRVLPLMSQISLPNGHAVSDFSVVGIGASAGGLDAYRKLLAAMPDNSGMAFILVQDLDPTHESMIVELLADATKMPVNQAVDGMPVLPNQVYVIPPGAYLSVVAGALHLSAPGVRHGSRLPFDFLLRSLATEYGARAVAVILSGNGADGTLGLRSIHNEGGLVIAQDPAEAQYDGMPTNAVRSGLVDRVLRLEDIPRALIEQSPSLRAPTATIDTLPAIVDFLRTRTGHDFTLYKAGTLRRRIERRLALFPRLAGDMAAYLALLRADNAEPDLLAADLLINVTSFFRDASVFALLNDTVIPDLVRTHGQDTPIRVWIAGCSSGEEAYSIAILFREQITALRQDVKLQIFASDVDAEAVALAREGFYPSAIEHDVSAERLSRFFSKETNGYRVAPELRSCVVFTVHDLLLDPPFARLDLISCRNLMIYFQPEAQAKIISVFHFALGEGGLLLLGSAETVGDASGRFVTVAKPERLYRRIGQRGSVPIDYTPLGQDGTRARPRAGQNPAQPRHAVLAELCRRMVIECFAPAAILINRKHECLYLLGPTDRYLTVPAGHPSSDLLAMARTDVRPKLRAAIQQAGQTNQRVTISGGRLRAEDGPGGYSIDVQPLKNEGEDLLLICFTEAPDTLLGASGVIVEQDGARVVELERELSETKGELRAAIRDLEISNEEQKIINEEALSVNEEHQSTNEELLTSKEELQSLNEELTALNSQLQETLERQRTTSNDLQNVLYSTDVATLFLDAALNIRFFTPATKALFNVIATDIGRPLTDLRSLAQDAELLNDAKQVLTTSVPVERDIDSRQGIWYMRRIFPYRTQTEGVEGVVITFSDITERRNTADALNAAKRQAEQANTAKSRFLAAASHDLRQPLQTLTLVQGLLAKSVTGPMALKLVDRMTKTLTTMSDMLNALLDINQIDAGAVHAEFSNFPINFLLEPIRDEFAEIAQAKGLKWRVVPSALVLNSDPRLLGQMLRNLVANAIKYTDTGTVLLGCRRRAGAVVLEVWDTGHGIPEAELTAIFDEYHQLENAAREQCRGLGLGLSIVQRLGKLLGHQVRVRSRPTRGSVFSIEIASDGDRSEMPLGPVLTLAPPAKGPRGNGSILVVDDDPDLCDLLAVFLQGEGYRTESAHDGVAALRRWRTASSDRT